VSLFFRSSVAELLEPVHALDRAGSGAGASILTAEERERFKADTACKGNDCGCAKCLDGPRALDPCVNGFRVLTRDAQGNPTAAEPCDAPAANTPSQGGKLTPQQQAAIGALIGSAVDAFGKALAPKSSAPPPPTPTIINGIPDLVTIGAFLLVLVVVVVKFK
jgi:hypothetical protein